MQQSMVAGSSIISNYSMTIQVLLAGDVVVLVKGVGGLMDYITFVMKRKFKY